MAKTIVKLFVKAYEYLCRILTKIVQFLLLEPDPTQILLKLWTPLQRRAAFDATEPTADPFADPMTIQVLIPFRDHVELTKRCFAGLYKQNLDSLHLNVTLIDNGSEDPETLAWLDQVRDEAMPDAMQVDVMRQEIPFNFSILNNRAVASQAKTDFVLFLNNDVELVDPDSLIKLARQANDTNVGAVGCTLCYPDQSVQHLFVAPGVKIVAAHPMKGTPYNPAQAWYKLPRPVPAVTGALLMMRRQTFDTLGGFDEKLPTVGQDVDLCLQAQKAGLANWVLPRVVAIHLETASRSPHIDRTEVEYIYSKWGRFLTKNPWYSGMLSRWSEQPVFALGNWAYPWEKIL